MIDVYFINCILAQLSFSLFFLIGISYQIQTKSLDDKLKRHEYKNRTDECDTMPHIGSTPL